MKRFAPLLLMSLLAAGCASQRALPTEQQLSLYRQASGEPVSSFPYFGRLNGWASLGREALVVWSSPTRAYLLDTDYCPDLEFAQAIQVSSNVGRVSARFDRVTPLGSGTTPRSCIIREIRPVDVRAVREAERQIRANRAS